MDHNINAKKLEKITKQEDLRLQVHRLWNVKATVKHVVIRVLGTSSDNLNKQLGAIGISITVSCLRRAALRGIAFSLSRVLGISEAGSFQISG